ncbi:DEAD/DEAH box helicase [Cellulomonas sp. ATA003]|uniref:DEAD/DEAH box helicase n=1 Tax=Cellulomonas sp. ATA003 TaxID=3073064 RepID=UPI002873D460|nr:DEAD/DEAH box helicase [Cellulomonas sp. ATA003]WNB86119.1 DEAD/DEAH box helicase [Cellulomonas sp. ATA003]
MTTTDQSPGPAARSSVQADNPTFADFDVRPEIVEALAAAGIISPFPIQAMTLPVALSGHDIIGQAKTGTGKTLGFGVPLLHRVVAPGEDGYDALPAPGKPQALVIVPTRELAVQVAGDLATASSRRSVRVLQLYGGRAYEPQVTALQTGVDVVVGTPGRMIDLLNQGYLDLTSVRCVVLDEADEMLDLGFLPDVERLLSRTPASRHTMLFSATMPGAVVAMARRYMTQPTHIRANDPDDAGATVKNTTQVVYRAHALDKVEVLARLLQAEGRGLTIVFARTKRTAAKVADDLVDRGFAAGAIHGDLGQGAREQALRAFRNGKVDVLVATDVAARGIDVDDVTHVVNYQCPEDEKTYLHRIGRTGRAGKKGTAVTFVDWDDMPRWGLINRVLDLGIPEPVETYSSSPHLFTDLGIPAGTKGTLPQAARVREGLDAEKLEDLGETGKRHSASVRGGGSRDGGGRDAGRGRGGRDGGRDGGRESGGRDSGRGRGASGRRDGGAGRGTEASGAPRTAGDDAPRTTPASASPSAEGSAPAETTGDRPRRNRSRRRTRSGGAGTSGSAASAPTAGPDA